MVKRRVVYEKFLQLAHHALFAKEPAKAILYAKRAKSLRDDDHRLYDILAESHYRCREYDAAVEAGENALILKDRLTNRYRAYPYPMTPPKPFDSTDSSKNVISYTLFGSDPKYCENALINVKLAKEFYPCWSCRFYCDRSVPLSIIERLRALGARVIIKESTQERSQMLLWRFLIMSDQSVERYIIRDCDSLLNAKEQCAVDAWIASGKRFHIMRDFYTHTDLILAGMFGGTTDLFVDIEQMIARFHQIKEPNISHQDQLFLRIFVWKTLKHDALIHDSYFRLANTRPFPPHPPIPQGEHVGACHQGHKLP